MGTKKKAPSFKRKRLKIFGKKVGLAPGEAVYLGDKQHLETKLEVFDYTIDRCDFLQTDLVSEAFKFKGNDRITWINVNGLSHAEEIIKIGEHFNLHPLIIEDIVDTSQRPKIDEYDNYQFIIMKMLYFNHDKEFIIEHISMVIGEDYVLTFQESEEDIFDAVRERIKNPESRVRKLDADYLGFALMDAIIDNYYTIIDSLTDRAEELEDELFFDNPRDNISKDIQLLKHDILRIRKNIFPSRDLIIRLVQNDGELIDKKVLTFYKDLQDQIIQINENIDVLREMIWGLMDMHMTTISNKMNNIMKVLTIMASIFIPLTFIAGIYGMNFEYMPELKYKYGYFVVWGVMILVLIFMMFYFKRKKWL